ncbi:MAG: DUF2508 family protein [Eubacteriales bacterium]|nr:DUF2508 family protein [Eubacteriales bacterium]
MKAEANKKANNEAVRERRIARLMNLLMIKDKTETDGDFCLQNRDEKTALIEDICNARVEWQSAVNEFENVQDKEIVDYCIYKIKAYQIRYEYLLKRAREKGVNMDIKNSSGSYI